ncbi:MAG TPA: hypothetical protein PLV59_02910 [Candidatus Dojkabacteria bacterium]|nr:hypothetical protein [Candidatus Dojkabacteria bacterium]
MATSPLKPTNFENAPQFGVHEFPSTPSPVSPNEQAQKNTDDETKTAKVENWGYMIFSRVIDRLRGTGKKIEPCTGAVIALDEEKQKELGVEVIKDKVENPLGRVEGKIVVPFVSDLHYVGNPQEVVRTYAMADKGALVYKLIRNGELKAESKIEDVDATVRSERFKTLVEILPRVVQVEEDEMEVLKKDIELQIDSPEQFKWAWNRAVIFRKRWSDEGIREDMIKELEETEKEETSKDTIDTKTFVEEKRWKLRNEMLKVLIPELFRPVTEGQDNATLLFMSGGDEAHDGGQLSDHVSVREIFYGMLSKSKFGRKVLGYIWGNHDEDAREPENLAELNKYYGDKIFYQEILPAQGTEGGKKSLVVGLNTFMMAEGYWDKVLELYLGKRKDPQKVDHTVLQYIMEMKDRFEDKQLQVIEKMTEMSEGNIIIHAHNSRRLIDYLVKREDKIKFNPKVNIKIISGHTHDDENFRFLADIGNHTVVEVYKSSGFVEINGESIRLPKGLVTEIDEKGDVKVKSVAFNQEQVEDFKRIFGVKVK